MSTCFNLSTTLKVIIWIRIHVDQVLLKTQFCKVVHINEFQFNIILTIIWTNFFFKLSYSSMPCTQLQKKVFDEKDRCPLSLTELNWTGSWERVIIQSGEISAMYELKHTSESADWCDYWSYTLKLTKQISPLIGMVIIAETRNPAQPIFAANWLVWNRFPKY